MKEDKKKNKINRRIEKIKRRKETITKELAIKEERL